MSIPFPAYRTPAGEREIAGLRTDSILTEYGEIVDCADYDWLKTYLERQPALVLAPPLLRWRYLAQAAADPDAQVLLAPRGGGIGGIRIRNRRDRRRVGWVIPITSWLPQRHIDPRALRTVRAVCDRAGVGVVSTPSALGRTLMRTLWDGPPLYRPPLPAWRTLHRTIHGGRVDCPGQGRRVRYAWGEDMASAYPWAAQSVPGGTTRGFVGVPPDDCATYYQDCAVWLPPEQPRCLGPLPVTNRWYETTYSTEGYVEGWWWKEEIEDALAAGGVVVERRDGYCWPRLVDSLGRWSQGMYALRFAAESQEVQGIIKLASVAGIGRFGMDRQTQRLVPYEDGLTRWEHDGRFAVISDEAETEGQLVHCASYIHMQVRRSLYQRALPFAERGALLATNYDELLCTVPHLGESGQHPASGVQLGDWKGNPGESRIPLGAWKPSQYRNLIVRHPRWKEGELWRDGRWERVSIRPGVAREEMVV